MGCEAAELAPEEELEDEADAGVVLTADGALDDDNEEELPDVFCEM